MFTQIHRFIIAFLFVTIPLGSILGCGSDDEPPATPWSVRSIAGDGLVTVEWLSNGEADLAGYKIWRDDNGDETFDLLAEVSSNSSSYVDEEVINGRAYTYAISAVDHDGNESELSPACSIADCGSDFEPPAIPRGVMSITGDGSVTVEWFPNGEADLAGYRIWRDDNGDQEFDLLAEASPSSSSFVDEEVINGNTYSYAISAVDYNGNESELSPEQVFDTPRPSGNNIILNDFSLIPDQSGFDFSQPARGAISWDSSGADIYFAFNPELNIRFLYSDNFTEMQDMGYHEYFDEVDISPVRGFVTEFIEIIEGHVYTLLTPDGNFAKIHIVAVSDTAVTFNWAYQTDPDNPQLAPAAHEISELSR